MSNKAGRNASHCECWTVCFHIHTSCSFKVIFIFDCLEGLLFSFIIFFFHFLFLCFQVEISFALYPTSGRTEASLTVLEIAAIFVWKHFRWSNSTLPGSLYHEILENPMWIAYLEHSTKALGADSSSYYNGGLTRHNLLSCFPLQRFPKCL